MVTDKVSVTPGEEEYDLTLTLSRKGKGDFAEQT